MPDYGATLGRDTGEALLRLCCNDPVSAKMPALIAYVQNGIDLFHLHQLGLRWSADGGHGNGRKLPMAFAAVMLNDQSMKETVMKAAQALQNDAGVFGEDGHLYTGVNGVVLFGKRDRWWSEKAYWHNFVSISSKDYRDPYGYIDGGHQQEGAYQVCCTSFMWKGTALVLWLIPELKRVWNNELFTTYVDRYVTKGRIYAPDPCSPYDGNWANYGKTYGPDGKGGFIKGSGRMPSWNGLHKDEGYYGSTFANEMWTRYRRGE
jgi:hypothetical protein